MNSKGQMGVGMLVMIAVAVIVGAVFLQSIAQSVGSSTDTITVSNESISTVVNGTTQYLTDYRSISDVVVYNETDDAIILAGNYTITNNVINPTTGALCVSILPDTTADYKTAWEVSGTAQPLTYIADSGSRAMTNLIVVMFALAILAVVLLPVVKETMNWK